MLRYAIVLCVVFVAAYASQAIGFPDPKPEKFKDVPGCYIKELDEVLPIGGEAVSKSSCLNILCGEKNVIYHGCSSIGVSSGCELVTDESLPYPDCCPKLKC